MYKGEMLEDYEHFVRNTLICRQVQEKGAANPGCAFKRDFPAVYFGNVLYNS